MTEVSVNTGLKLGVDNAGVFCYYMSVGKNTEYKVREEQKMGCKVRFNAQEEYNAGYQAGLQDYQDKMPVFYDMTRTNIAFVDGYNDAYSGKDSSKFYEEELTQGTQESEFDTVANAMTEWTPEDLSRMAYWALDLLHNTTGLTKEMDKCIGLAKIELELLQQIINDRD